MVNGIDQLGSMKPMMMYSTSSFLEIGWDPETYSMIWAQEKIRMVHPDSEKRILRVRGLSGTYMSTLF
jgi:hypothetical protein